jgi:hypothetical protein
MVESTAQTTTTTDELSVRFEILDILRGLENSHGILQVGARPGIRTNTGLIAQDMKQYYIIKTPKAQNIVDI